MPSFFKQILIGLTVGALTSLPFIWYTSSHSQEVRSTVSPSLNTNQILSSHAELSKEIAGFYPYWNLSKVSEVDLTNLTTVYYFALDLNGDGTWNQDDPGISKLRTANYQLLKEKVLRNGTRWGLTIVNLSADSIAKNISNPVRQQTIIKNTIKMMKQENFQDLNIDLEYAGDPDDNLKKSFTRFVQNMTQAVKAQIPDSRVSIDFFADTYEKPRIYDLTAMSSLVDHVIIMGYDFHRLSSLTAGPVAPLFGKEKYKYDITTSVAGYQKFIPPSKIILGVPFYGYEWPTLDNQKGAFTISSLHGPEISSYARSLETATKNHASVNFDDESKSVWFSYFDTDYKTWRQVWFENQRSLGLKFDLVNDAGLGGIAIFALGYDGGSAKPLWDEVKLKFP
ncbi:MAG: hypothetical protein UY21_C0022G0010 [Microgenomates group bacterium GW2011_GWA1_48_10]|uniref:GH18 domain-containing protein n=1 Tax=Candidatus Gottesmanbacteria bacterium RIFCSPHIGHO2_01_FULL_47_48 TaxID=1798381 RepID=A0A1F6A1F9_9BACT|nr:MAG: hypothetical protein UY21_C0022G0010 [Microgenomates group bacterium GW2011_GWA1_48_10]OGG18444.1 MAG: hypothetical protein A2721_01505 [Candidatus Gottesmanbacteria bacterium RIFCSPHIGHO2_01_FULL_47_48]